MTEKRFIVIDDGLDFMVRDTFTGDNLIDADGVADVLNDYEEENEQLKKRIEHLERKIQRERTSAIKEHEKWEKGVIELIREQRKLIDDLNKENEQLKQKVEDLEFALRTEQAFSRTEKEEHSDSVYDFKKKLEKW